MKHLTRKISAILALALFSSPLWALTSGQFAQLAADINGQASLASARTNHDATIIAAFYNVTASPAYVVWKTITTRTEANVGMDWTRVDNLSVGKARIWDWMFNDGTINCADTGIRTGIDAVWVGTAADLAVRATVYAACKRGALRGEKLLAVGTGNDATPATMGYEGLIRDIDVQIAMGW